MYGKHLVEAVGNSSRTVQTTTMDCFLFNFHKDMLSNIGFTKIDTEGLEMAVFLMKEAHLSLPKLTNLMQNWSQSLGSIWYKH
jgi:hypothetical protein